MRIHQLFNHNPLRNFTYILEGEGGQCYVIDPWDAGRVLDFCHSGGRKLKAVLNTHEHFDHVQGNEELVRACGCEVWVHERALARIPAATHPFQNGAVAKLAEDSEIVFMDTPGHTFAHMCLIFKVSGSEQAVFTGDTLFNAGVGNCRNGGDVEALYRSIEELSAKIHDDVQIYPGHDYMVNNLRFTLSLTPENQVAKQYLEQANLLAQRGEFMLTTMKEEKKINTFLRLQDESLRKALGLGQTTDLEVFTKLRRLRDHW